MIDIMMPTAPKSLIEEFRERLAEERRPKEMILGYTPPSEGLRSATAPSPGIPKIPPEAAMFGLPSLDELTTWLKDTGQQWQAGQALVTDWRNFFDPPDTATQTYDQFIPTGPVYGPAAPAAIADRNWLPLAIGGAGLLALIFILRR
ncbi:hypothetical protein ES707_13394 [subsurface metagenome]